MRGLFRQIRGTEVAGNEGDAAQVRAGEAHPHLELIHFKKKEEEAEEVGSKKDVAGDPNLYGEKT